MTVEFTVSSDKSAVRERLRAVLILIAETLEVCIPVALDSIKQQGLPYSPYLFSTSVRCHVKKALKAGGYNAEDQDDQLPLVVNNISNDGIDFDAGSLHVKMLKGEDLPKAVSDSRKDFYDQQSRFPFAEDDFSEAPLRNVVVLWNYAEGNLSLQLIAPKKQNGLRLWTIDVPDPAEWLEVRERLDSRDEDLDVPRKKRDKASGGEEDEDDKD
jgi:hypothetical protein